MGTENSVTAQEPYRFKGSWIAATENINISPSPLFRKEFQTASRRRHYGDGMRIKKATLYICGAGYQIATINGKQVSDAVLEPGFTAYDKRLLYNKYDVTSLVLTGENVIAVELGNGWFNVQSKTIWNFDKIGWRKSPRLIADLVLEYNGGHREVISSDASWKTAYGAGQFNSLSAGEIYDARKEPSDWTIAGFDESGWKSALSTSSPGGKLEQVSMPQVKVIRYIKAKDFKELAKGVYLYDMGENFAGVVRLKITGTAGDKAVIKYSERLNADGTLDSMYNAGHMIGPASDPKFATDAYILKGGRPEIYTPRFTYHGFRYVQVNVSGDSKLSKSSVLGLFYSTDFISVGSFKSSSKMLNLLNAAAIRSYRSNFVGIPTDCPQREKMGWLADAHITCDLGLWNLDAASGYKKYLRDLRDVQLPDGYLPGVAPTKGIGYSWIDPKDRDFGPAWGSALPLIAWQVYLHTADTSVIKENYTAIRAYVDMLEAKSKPTGYIYRTGLDDFLSIEKTPKAFTSSLFMFRDAVVLSKMATILGKPSDAERYVTLAKKVKAAFNKEFFDAAAGSYKVKTLTALSGTLFMGICPDEAIKNVAAELAEGVKIRDFVPDFGVLGTKWVLSALSDNGHEDVAFELLKNPRAGWGKWIIEGATTLYEGWNPKEETLNHVFFGDYGAWFFRSLAGIKLQDEAPGFTKVVIAPVFPKGLNSLNISHKTKFGEIAIKWTRAKKHIRLTVQIPTGIDANFGVESHEQKLIAGRNNLVIK